jgi:hypothetical protein
LSCRTHTNTHTHTHIHTQHTTTQHTYAPGTNTRCVCRMCFTCCIFCMCVYSTCCVHSMGVAWVLHEWRMRVACDARVPCVANACACASCTVCAWPEHMHVRRGLVTHVQSPTCNRPRAITAQWMSEEEFPEDSPAHSFHAAVGVHTAEVYVGNIGTMPAVCHRVSLCVVLGQPPLRAILHARTNALSLC